MRRLRAFLVVLLIVPAVASAIFADEAKSAAPILSMAGHWRAFYVLKGPFIRDGAKLTQVGAEVATPAPPGAWRDADFDDAAWQRLRGQPCVPNQYGGACRETNAGFPYLDGGSTFQSLICLRGRFLATDPAQAGELSLSVEYRGGAVVYLNGREVARGIANYGAADLRRISGLQSDAIETTLGYNYGDEVIHRNDLILL